MDLEPRRFPSLFCVPPTDHDLGRLRPVREDHPLVGGAQAEAEASQALAQVVLAPPLRRRPLPEDPAQQTPGGQPPVLRHLLGSGPGQAHQLEAAPPEAVLQRRSHQAFVEVHLCRGGGRFAHTRNPT